MENLNAILLCVAFIVIVYSFTKKNKLSKLLKEAVARNNSLKEENTKLKSNNNTLTRKVIEKQKELSIGKGTTYPSRAKKQYGSKTATRPTSPSRTDQNKNNDEDLLLKTVAVAAFLSDGDSCWKRNSSSDYSSSGDSDSDYNRSSSDYSSNSSRSSYYDNSDSSYSSSSSSNDSSSSSSSSSSSD